jgi:hypothetical protein
MLQILIKSGSPELSIGIFQPIEMFNDAILVQTNEIEIKGVWLLLRLS